MPRLPKSVLGKNLLSNIFAAPESHPPETLVVNGVYENNSDRHVELHFLGQAICKIFPVGNHFKFAARLMIDKGVTRKFEMQS